MPSRMHERADPAPWPSLWQVSDAILDACLEQDPASKVRGAALQQYHWAWTVAAA
jgi:hypothetical protein